MPPLVAFAASSLIGQTKRVSPGSSLGRSAAAPSSAVYRRCERGRVDIRARRRLAAVPRFGEREEVRQSAQVHDAPERAVRAQPVNRDRRPPLLQRGGGRVRLFPGAQGGAARSDRLAPARVTALAPMPADGRSRHEPPPRRPEPDIAERTLRGGKPRPVTRPLRPRRRAMTGRPAQ
jgi:hypothetical protein